MKKLFSIILLLSLVSCGSSNDGNSNLPNVPVNLTVFLNLETSLQISGGHSIKQGGISGIVVYNFNGTTFYAYDLACPHLPVNQCTPMTVDAPFLKCTCDDSTFLMPFGGRPESGTQFPARQYKVIKSGNTLTIVNF